SARSAAAEERSVNSSTMVPLWISSVGIWNTGMMEMCSLQSSSTEEP
ncbi:SEPT7 isoform 7, partial [Pan troglodytes]